MTRKPSQGRERLDDYEAWSAFLLRWMFSLFGMAIIGSQVYINDLDFYEFVIGAACMGPLIVNSVVQIIVAFKGGSERER